MYRSVFAFLCVLLAVTVASNGPSGKRILALLDSMEIKGSHSIFFKSLEDRGFTLQYALATDKSVTLQKYGEWQYDNLILFAPSTRSLSIPVQNILEFIDAGHNVLVGGDSSIARPLRILGSECNVEFDEAGTNVIDHFNFDKSDFDGKHTLIASDQILQGTPVVEKITAPVLFRGVGQDIEENSALIFPVLTGYSTTYSHAIEEAINSPHVAGKKTVLVSALQARNNARVIFSGSLELFGNKFFQSSVEKYSADGKSQKFEKSGNEQFAKSVSQWVFQERGILRARDVSHHKVGETQSSSTYTIKDQIQYSVVIEEWKGKSWVPFQASDVQLEWRMIDPYVRTTLKGDSQGKYSTTFTLPDVYGVFTFKVEYTRQGYGFLNVIDRVPVRPFRHSQYERFIPAAYPYYASAFSMLGGLFVFSWFFLYHREKK